MRNKKWKKTEYGGRKRDWLPHDLIIDELIKFPTFSKASEDQDYGGIDVWKSIPFDVKVTDGKPRTLGSVKLKDYELFKWLLQHQDLNRFHPTNRIIVITHKTKEEFTPQDARQIAKLIDHEFSFERYYSDIDYTLLGTGDQTSDPYYGQRYRMKMGLFIRHY